MRRIGILCGMFCGVIVHAASPSFESFDTSFFRTNGYRIGVNTQGFQATISGATNAGSGRTNWSVANVTNAGTAAYSNGVDFIARVAGNGVNNDLTNAQLHGSVTRVTDRLLVPYATNSTVAVFGPSSELTNTATVTPAQLEAFPSDILARQLVSANLTNWSGRATNSFVASTNGASTNQFQKFNKDTTNQVGSGHYKLVKSDNTIFIDAGPSTFNLGPFTTPFGSPSIPDASFVGTTIAVAEATHATNADNVVGTGVGTFSGDGNGLTNLSAYLLTTGTNSLVRTNDGRNLKFSGSNTLTGVLDVEFALRMTNNAGSAGQVLTSAGSTLAPFWSVSTVTGAITNGNTATVDLGSSAWSFGGDVVNTNISALWRIRGSGGPPARYGFIAGYDGSLGADSGLNFRTTNGAGSFVNTLSIGNSFGVAVVGNLSCTGTKPFVIPHPLGATANALGAVPMTNLLRHAAIEGPRGDLIYRGTVTLTNGQARVSIDQASRMTIGTFAALTRNPQGWAQNVTGWDALQIRVDAGDVVIFCSNPHSGDTVSWFVMAERNDPNYLNSSCDADGNFRVQE